MKLQYLCDNKRHLICIPYSEENLHLMAQELGIKRCWFNKKDNMSHYDIPKRRIDEITKLCTLIETKNIIEITKNGKLD